MHILPDNINLNNYDKFLNVQTISLLDKQCFIAEAFNAYRLYEDTLDDQKFTIIVRFVEILPMRQINRVTSLNQWAI